MNEKHSPDQNDKNEIPAGAGRAHDIEHELDLGKQTVSPPVEGMPSSEGGGLTSEIGSSP
jgi:hypothetical protein